MEWTSHRIRLLRDVGLCQSQDDFAKTLGVAKRTIGNAERGTHPPSLVLRRALDQVLEHASDIQRNRFFAAITADTPVTSPDLGVAAAASLVSFPVTPYADAAYLDAAQEHIWQIIKLDGRFGGTELAPLTVRFFRSVHQQLGSGT